MSRLEKNLGSLPCGHVMHFACLQTAFNSKKECPICRAAYPQPSVKIQKLFFDCSRASSALDSSHDSSFAVDSSELEELNGRIEEKNVHIRMLESALNEEKQASRGLAAQLDDLRGRHERECADRRTGLRLRACALGAGGIPRGRTAVGPLSE